MPRRRQFASRAYPVLEQLAQIGLPALTLDVVQTSAYLASTDPVRAVSAAADAVDHSVGFGTEGQGEEAVLKLLESYVGDFHDILVNDPIVTD